MRLVKLASWKVKIFCALYTFPRAAVEVEYIKIATPSVAVVPVWVFVELNGKLTLKRLESEFVPILILKLA